MNPNCPRCGAGCSIRFGRFFRADDTRFVQRYRCTTCKKCFSTATFTPTYRQKRRSLNPLIHEDIASCTSQRRIAIRLGCSRATVDQKIRFLATQARFRHVNWLTRHGPFEHVQMDELITFEHTRLKPLSVCVITSVDHRYVLGFGVAQIPASGTIAKKSREIYGNRPDNSGPMRRDLLARVSPLLSTAVLIQTDEHKRYAAEISRELPEAIHEQFKSVRGSLSGQGELKRNRTDPLFPINHTLAMLRDNIKRLSRKTWCTTKLSRRLEDIIQIYIDYLHTTLLSNPLPKPTAKCNLKAPAAMSV